MERELKELQKWLNDVNDFSLPQYKELPGVDLYMEQVLKYINETLSAFSPDDQKILTSFMVNNYVKAKMIDEPKKKRYNKEQIGYLMAITLMKNTISMSDMALLLEMDKNVSLDKGRLYAFYCDVQSALLHESSKTTKSIVDNFAKKYQNEVNRKNLQADDNLRNSLGLLALRLAIRAEANKLLSDQIIRELRQDMHGARAVEIESTPGHDEIRRENKIGKGEARRLAIAKEAAKKGK
jgi:hypothetical protein